MVPCADAITWAIVNKKTGRRVHLALVRQDEGMITVASLCKSSIKCRKNQLQTWMSQLLRTNSRKQGCSDNAYFATF